MMEPTQTGAVFFFFNLSPKTKETKTKRDKSDSIKLKAFPQQKHGQIKKKALLEWGKIILNDMTDKGLISRIYK